jgi:hypothetical protein
MLLELFVLYLFIVYLFNKHLLGSKEKMKNKRKVVKALWG